VISARCGHYAGLRHLAAKQICERPPRLERSGVLQELELEEHALGLELKIRSRNFQGRRAADMRPDQALRVADRLARNARFTHGALKPMLQWVPSQNGLFLEPPQRQSV
jgi:hypothetical protein